VEVFTSTNKRYPQRPEYRAWPKGTLETSGSVGRCKKFLTDHIKGGVMEEQYSGDNSREFWGIINLIDDEEFTLYKLGCDLQNLECKVLSKINERRQIIERIKTSYNKRIKQGAKRPHAKRTS
jgi:hypothetical protein